MFNENFFQLVQFLKDKYEQDTQFNLFSVLRSESDEVRLHSRFLAEILNPRGTHGYQASFLKSFVDSIGIELNSPEKAWVITEYKNIDILIKCGTLAIVIENKIYANDQERQLARYHETMREEDFDDIYLVYLTLEDSIPSPQSTEGLDESFLNSDRFKCLSYKKDIYSWTENCLSLSAREPALRESFSQYLELIENLTGKVKSVKYMKELKRILKKDNNLPNFLDLQQAYNDIVIDLQVDLWARIQAAMQPVFGPPSHESIMRDETKKDAITKFMDRRRGSNFFGLFYPLGNGIEQIAIEMQDDGIIAGVSCSKEDSASRHHELIKLLSAADTYFSTSKWWPCYRYLEPHINYRNLTNDSLSILVSEVKRQGIADKTAGYLADIRGIIEK